MAKNLLKTNQKSCLMSLKTRMTLILAHLWPKVMLLLTYLDEWTYKQTDILTDRMWIYIGP